MVVGADGAAHKKTVQLGLADAEDVQVLSGLAPSDTVISTGAYGLDDGVKVKVGPAEADDDKKPAADGANAGEKE